MTDGRHRLLLLLVAVPRQRQAEHQHLDGYPRLDVNQQYRPADWRSQY